MIYEILLYFVILFLIGFVEALHKYIMIIIVLTALVFVIVTAIFYTKDGFYEANVWITLSCLAGNLSGLFIGSKFKKRYLK